MDLIALSCLTVRGRHLVTLHLLLDSQSVTRTAERLGPTLHRLLSELNNLTSQDGFDPQTWQGQLRFALRESSMVWPMGPILGQLMQEVPGLEPNVWNKDEQGLTALAAGKLDFVILPHDQSQPLPRQPGLVWETLREDRLVCLLRADHPALDKPWDLDAYLSWRHIAIRDQELANPFFEQSLAQLQVRRQIGATLPDFGSASALLRQSDLILTAIEGWALQSAALGLAIRPVPFDYGAVTHSLVWYGPAGEEPALRWFRQRILTLARELG
ncbi:LysR family transcriptional regulator [Aeromonas salmonicida subsp. achromogenes]|uniref:LysR substrate-binding domain-containing protein n=1 Tax=Aeromonas salmonicida TaxID=645 RepID=UPI0002F3CBED|nr:LysR substrate-binding domain-containing protein [Aeromonas salmonicida]TMX08730.1 LysR family transcriptional regulator [Aeromonas salmonicida subsp. achromogenes]TMX10413.1 LysR family transcriptional regulator [Aeromonas salmonicida subsp. achromogenes]TMX11168.1 LysR family transcriptional regulator [Aeromonas salmonicida subsp. achromogenes]TMX18702.1 LysR family transcriptional regulator [Aeromonas salmonicida subsp. achromogenes]